MRKNNSSLLIHMSYFMFDIHHDRIWGVSLKPSDQILSPVDWGWKYFQGKKIAVDGCRAYDVNNFVCVCVCLYSSTVKAFSVCKMSETYLRAWINDLVLWISVDSVMPSSIIAISENVIFHLQRRKLQPLYYWRENDMI